MTERLCCCSDWRENIDRVNGPIVLAQVRSGHAWTGKPFNYCPWCGNLLQTITTADQPGAAHEQK